MTRLWYVVYTQTYEGGVSFLKDPDFCRGNQKPFETYQKADAESPEAFTPWMTLHKMTAFAQTNLLEQRDSVKHFVGAFEMDFSQLIDMAQLSKR